MRKRELTPERRELLTALNSAPEALTPAALAQRLGKDRESVKRLLYKCVDDAQVVAAEGGYTTSEYYRNVSRVDEFVHDKPFSGADSPPAGTDNDGQSPPVGTEPGTGPVPAHEEAGVSTIERGGRGGKTPANAPNPLGIGLFCAEPPSGLPAGTYPAKRDELGRLVPDFSLPALPKGRDFRG